MLMETVMAKRVKKVPNKARKKRNGTPWSRKIACVWPRVYRVILVIRELLSIVRAVIDLIG